MQHEINTEETNFPVGTVQVDQGCISAVGLPVVEKQKQYCILQSMQLVGTWERLQIMTMSLSFSNNQQTSTCIIEHSLQITYYGHLHSITGMQYAANNR